MSCGYWDIHNHILPGLDDGASCLEETCDLLREEYRQGVRNIIFTPHHRPKLFRVSREDRERVFRRVSRELKADFPDMRFYLGCEFFAHENMAEELADIRCRMAGTNVVLTEFSTVSHYADMKRWLEEMLDAGYVPVIAHAERYRCLYQSEERLRKLRDMGVPVQLNAGGILGREGAPVRRFCLRVLQEGIADFIASDAHSMDGRPVEMAACRKKVQRRFGKEKADWWFCGAQEKLFREAGASSQIQ